jgi:ATP adenylyltransferase
LVEREGAEAYPVLVAWEHAILLASERPYNSGQLVVHPRRHVVRHSDLSVEERGELWDLGRLASEILQEAYRPQGMNLGYTSPKPGEHLRLEVIPRWVGDTNFMPLVAGKTLLPEMPEQTYERLKEVLAARGGSAGGDAGPSPRESTGGSR